MWVLLALLTAVCTALRDAGSKEAAGSTHPIVVAFWIALIPAAVLGFVLVAGGMRLDGGGFGSGFWTALAISGAINAIATPLIVWALRRSDLSLVAPLTSLTPLFMVLTGAVILGERPSATGALGVTTIVAGAYVLKFSDRQVSRTAPIAALLRDPGARAMLLVSFLYSISAAYDKVGVGASSPVLWAGAVQGTVTLALLPLALLAWRGSRSRATPARSRDTGGNRSGDTRTPWLVVPAPTAIVVAGAVSALGMVAQNTALTLTFAAYVIAVKRTSTLFGVLIGHLWFRERRIGERALGAAVMLVGFVLVTLG